MNKMIQLSIFAGVLLSTNAFAATETANLEGVAKMNSACSISAQNLNFGNIVVSPTGSLNSTTNIIATCSKEASFTISFDGGKSENPLDRNMIGDNSLDSLKYNVYKNSAHSEVLGDGNSSTYIISDIGTGIEQTFDIYGKMPLNQYTTPDTYSDTLTVVLNY